MDMNTAISIKSIAFSYSKNTNLLNNINIDVPKGQIYALLGSNGCGKTTLIKILMGRLRPNQGQVHILGHQVTTKSNKLNHVIGYMPQEIALNPYMYIKDTFYYFARVNHITDTDFIQKQIANYLNMLGLRNPKQLVGDLSGGQQRLLSLGVTLIYEPRILFLDEPTVGVDSLIRAKIWDYLRAICIQRQTTVLITTHYIDEAKQSDLVGFLKQGRMLAEDSPITLMRGLQCCTLEEVFYKLCIMHQAEENDDYSQTNNSKVVDANNNNSNNINNNNNNSINNNNNNNNYNYNYPMPNDKQACNGNALIGNGNEKITNVNELLLRIENNGIDKCHEMNIFKKKLSHQDSILSRYPCINSYLNMDHLSALFYREMLLSKRVIIMLSLYFLLPVLISYLFYSSYGRTPKNLPLAIVNHDSATTERLSELYLSQLEEGTVKLNYYPTEREAFESVKLGKNFMALSFPANFSEAFIKRYSEAEELLQQDRLLKESSMNMMIDGTNLINIRFLNRTILRGFREMMKIFSKKHFENPNTASLPIVVKEVVYGSVIPDFHNFFLPGVLIVGLFGLNMIKAALSINELYMNGCMVRDFIQGVKPIELLLTMQMAALLSMLTQVVIIMLFMFFIQEIPQQGNMYLIFFLILMLCIQGYLIGTLISTLLKSQIFVFVSCFAVIAIIFFTSGALWPVEGMRRILQKVFLANPTMATIQSVRSIMLRGYPLHFGFIQASINSVALFIIQILFFHYMNIV